MVQKDSSSESLDGSDCRSRTVNAWQELDPSGSYEKLGYWLITLEEVIGWYCRATYSGHSLKRVEEGWRLIVWATFRQTKKVCFIYHDTPIECIRTFAYEIKGGRVQWKHDQYA